MMDITMTAWTENAAGGGFGYVRSTPEYLARAIAILAILAVRGTGTTCPRPCPLTLPGFRGFQSVH